MDFLPSKKTCNLSIVFGEEDAGSEGGGGCETTVVRMLLPPTELKTSSFETRCAGTEMNFVVSSTVTSKVPGEVDFIRTP